uniref:CCHC-type domain-containing protein n=1 Tax=Cannabis sativa TaxID=3483 RepID=A0A803NZM7_CANSA
MACLWLLFCMMMAGDTMTEVDDIVSMTSKLGVEQEEDWEENCEAVTSFGGNSLVGKVISKRDIGERLLLNMFGRMWKGITDWEVKMYDEDGDSYVVGFSFKSKKDASVVLSKQPWFFNGGLLILEEWPDTGQWKDFKLEKISCWIKMKGMPLKMFTQKNLRRLGEMAGEIEEFKWHNDRRMFLNGYVRMRIGFPLNRNLFVGRFIPSEGKQHWVQIKFERLSMLCYGCGRWGHEQKECDKPVAMEKDVQGQLVPKYGSWLKEDDPRPNCFVAFKQAQVASASEAYGIDELVGGERSVRFDRDRGDRSSGNPDERTDGAEVVGELPVGAVSQVVAEHQEIVGNGVEGTRMGLDYIAKESGEGRGLGRDSGLLLKSPYNFNVIDSAEVGRGSQSVGPVDKPRGNSVTINHHQPAEYSDGDVDFKKRKSTGGGSAEELDRGRRYFNKGKQIVEDEGFLTEKSETGGSRLGHGEGNSKHNGGQRKKVSIKNRARNLAKAAPAVAVNRARGEEMMHPATVEHGPGPRPTHMSRSDQLPRTTSPTQQHRAPKQSWLKSFNGGSHTERESTMVWAGEDWGSLEKESSHDDLESVKIKISKKELEKLVSRLRGGEDGMSVEQVLLSELMKGKGGGLSVQHRYYKEYNVDHDHQSHWENQRSWRPVLQSIPEVN